MQRRRGLRNTLRRRLSVSWPAQLYTDWKYPKLFEGIAHFCLFIGHGRSGSTLVGALLNAHPDIVLSNELDVLKHLDKKYSQDQLFRLIYYQSRRQARQGSKGGGGYTYRVPGQWQGRHRAIRVIGDRKAGATALHLFNQPDLAHQLRNQIGTPIKLICVIRNPFDTLATTFEKTSRLAHETEEAHLSREIDLYFDRSSAIQRAQRDFGTDALKFVHHEQLITNARSVLIDLCTFLDVTPDESYVAECAKIVRPSASITRTRVKWTAMQIAAVTRRSAEFSWLERYTFDSE